MLIMPCVFGLLVLAEPIIKYLFQYGAWTSESTHAVAVAIMIQVFALPAMLVSQIYSKTLYASQDVKTPVKTSMVSLGVAAILYFAMFPVIGYLSIPVGIVVSGYIKNYLLGRACRTKGLFRWDGRTIRAITFFTVLAGACGFALSYIKVTSIFALAFAILGYALVYLPIAYIVDRKIIK